MFSKPTRRAMLALAAGDLEGTPSDRDAFARFLGSRQTVHALVKAGVLDGASGRERVRGWLEIIGGILTLALFVLLAWLFLIATPDQFSAECEALRAEMEAQGE